MRACLTCSPLHNTIRQRRQALFDDLSRWTSHYSLMSLTMLTEAVPAVRLLQELA